MGRPPAGGESAIEVLEKGTASPLYGIVEFVARTRIDKESRLVVIDELQGMAAKLPGNEKAEPKLLGAIQKHFGEPKVAWSLDRFEAELAAERAEAKPVEKVENDPPKIVFAESRRCWSTSTARRSGAASRARSTSGCSTPGRWCCKDGAGGFHLRLFDGWLAAPNLGGPWKVEAAPRGASTTRPESALAPQPADLLDGGTAEEVDAEGKPIPKPTLAKGPVPEVVVVTEPTELVVFDGAAKWQAIPGTALEFVENTTGNVFRTTGGADYYVLLSGRWFAATSLDGPWAFVPQAELAADFGKIPDESPKENVKASVAGTPQAEEAVIANSIPQTSEVKRAEAKFEPTIDGEPQFEPVEGDASLAYVKNSPTPILRVPARTYYAVHDGVWFVAPARRRTVERGGRGARGDLHDPGLEPAALRDLRPRLRLRRRRWSSSATRRATTARWSPTASSSTAPATPTRRGSGAPGTAIRRPTATAAA